MPAQRVCLYAGSHAGARPEYADATRELVELLARAGFGIVFGGGRVGLMGVIAEAGAAAGTEVIGVIPEHLEQREAADDHGISELRVVGSMHERKALMAELSCAFITLPGGIGTLEETIEMLTWAQLELHDKPCGLLNVGGYYDPLIAFLDRAVEQRFLAEDARGLLTVAAEPRALLHALLPARRSP